MTLRSVLRQTMSRPRRSSAAPSGSRTLTTVSTPRSGKTREILFCCSSLTNRNPPRSSQTGPSLNPKPPATFSSEAPTENSSQKRGDSALSSNCRGGALWACMAAAREITASRVFNKLILPEELQAHLADAAGAGAGDAAEVAAGKAAGRIGELRVLERIE